MLNDIKNEKYKPRYHLGIIKPKSVALPTAFVDAVRNILEGSESIFISLIYLFFKCFV